MACYVSVHIIALVGQANTDFYRFYWILDPRMSFDIDDDDLFWEFLHTPPQIDFRSKWEKPTSSGFEP